ncbi:hypothetical protein XAP6164_1270012 [Xanthomonas phaseoli pv. phaseoli]|nr:hypothetical protein XAP6164_1270012 [Xanthomonas phaseoli pv. phaseoli]
MASGFAAPPYRNPLPQERGFSARSLPRRLSGLIPSCRDKVPRRGGRGTCEAWWRSSAEEV